MVDRIILVERKRHDEGHWIRPSPPTGNTEQQYRVFFEGEEIGVWRVPSCSAARWLLEHGKAERDDTLRVYRGDMPSLTGNVGWFADHTIAERDGAPRFVKWVPRPEGTLPPRGGVKNRPSEDFSGEGA